MASVGVQAQTLAPVLAAAARKANELRGPVLASAVIPFPAAEPVRLFCRARELASSWTPSEQAKRAGRLRWTDSALWAVPSCGTVLVGAGTAWALEASGVHRFRRIRDLWRQALADAVIEGLPGTHGTGPVALGGFAFDPMGSARRSGPGRPGGATGIWSDFPDAWLAVPRFLLTQARDETWLTVNVRLTPGSDPAEEIGAIELDLADWLAPPGLLDPFERAGEAPDPTPGLLIEEVEPDRWSARVQALARDIRRGKPVKAVLARQVRLQAHRPFTLSRVLQALLESYPNCSVFAFCRGSSCFVGATPEWLVRLRERQLYSMALAGSAARGLTEEDDRHLAQALLQSQKERTEHALVLAAIQEALRDLCETLELPSEPGLLHLPTLQHLYTPVTGRIRAGYTVLDVVERLHPTPAVGGYPREAALQWLAGHEQLDRGWYAGPVGWIDPQGGGEFAVAIRSALVQGRKAWLFAGCGIMAESDPAREYEESWLKLQPMLRALRQGLPAPEGSGP